MHGFTAENLKRGNVFFLVQIFYPAYCNPANSEENG
jgi:hypothetical protein